jgi:hypothetical protein
MREGSATTVISNAPPPFRELGAERLLVREDHLLHAVGIQPRRYRGRLLVAAAVVVAAVIAAPALAFSTTVRELVGLSHRVSPPFLVATVTSVVVHKHQPVPMVTISVTVGEHGKSIGAGVPLGSDFQVFVWGKLLRDNFWHAEANGARGRYSATLVQPRGGVRMIQIGGYEPNDFGYAAGGQFWLPVDAFPARK